MPVYLCISTALQLLSIRIFKKCELSHAAVLKMQRYKAESHRPRTHNKI